jgi:hypothetical protein
MYATYEQQMIAEALEEHNNGCCTEDSPCLWRKGLSIVLNKNELRPIAIATENAPFRAGGSGSGRATRKVSPTPAQQSLWDKLMTEMRQYDKRDSTDAAEMINELWEAVSDFKKYSKLIDETIMGLRSRKVQTAGGIRVPAAVSQTEELKPGLYSRENQTYKVRISEAGRAYALKLVGTKFEYERGAINLLKAEHLMTLEEAKAHGRRTGVCCQCGKELTNPVSIREGIGPICASRF